MMQVGYQWLKEYIAFEWTPEELADRLTAIGTAVEDIAPVFAPFSGVVVGRIEKAEAHPSRADLRVVTVASGNGPQRLVCGAPNAHEGLVTPVALPGAKLPGGREVRIAEVAGVSSPGFCCSEAELGLSEAGATLMELDAEAFEIGDDLWRAMRLEDWSLTFELTPNRSDCLSALGIAREIGALIGARVRRPEISHDEAPAPAGEGDVEIVIDDPVGCPRYAGRVLTGGRVGESPFWLKWRLKSAGIRSISNAVDITNFVMIESGQPLHAFDHRLFDTGRVVVRAAREGEKFRTLDDVDRTMPPEAVMITNGERAVAMGGVMGGQESEVSSETTDFLLESAYFNPGRIRRARTRIGLQTDAAYRFERGTDPNGVPYALARAVDLFATLIGATPSRHVLDNYPEPVAPLKIELRPERVDQILGTRISTPSIIDHLSALEFGIATGKTVTVTVPTFRPDCTREIDLIEEVARIHGYEDIPTSKRAAGAVPTPIPRSVAQADRLRELLVGHGLTEIVTNSMYDAGRQLRSDAEAVRIKNPLSEDLTIMRTDLYAHMLGTIAHNRNRRVESLALFEWGKVFAAGEGGEGFEEHNELCIGLCGRSDGGWDVQVRDYDFFDLKGVLEGVAMHYGEELTLKPGMIPPFADDAGYEILFGDRLVGQAGSVAHAALERYDIEAVAWLASLDSKVLAEIDDDGPGGRTRAYEPVPRYPASLRDIALVVDADVPSGEIEAAIREAGGDLLASLRLFDLYTGKQIPTGKKSLAYALTYRLPERTLSDAEVDERQAVIIANIKKRFRAELRA